MQGVIDEVLAGAAPLDAFEDAYNVMSRIVRNPNDATARKVQRSLGDVSKLLLAAGFRCSTGRPTSPLLALLGQPRSRVRSVSPSRRLGSPGASRHLGTPRQDSKPAPSKEFQFVGPTEPLLPLVHSLRVAIRSLWFPPSQPPSLAMRLAKLPTEGLVALLTAAAVRDRIVLNEVEATLAKLPAPAWPALPFLAVGIIGLKAQGLSALRWYAVCRNFRAAQVPVRVLAIGVKLDNKTAEKLCSFAPDGLLVVMRDNPYDARTPLEFDAHRVVEAISERHGREITHMIMAVALRAPNYPLRVKPFVPHGAQPYLQIPLSAQSHSRDSHSRGPWSHLRRRAVQGASLARHPPPSVMDGRGKSRPRPRFRRSSPRDGRCWRVVQRLSERARTVHSGSRPHDRRERDAPRAQNLDAHPVRDR